MNTAKLIKSLMLLLMGVCMLTACTSKEDELVGSWSNSFGINSNPYTEVRAIHKQGIHPTYIHTFIFEKGENGKGEFNDIVNPLTFSLQPDDWAVGSRVTGNWEIKDGKLYLIYDDEVTLLNSDKLDPELAEIIKDAMKKQLIDVYNKQGAKGLPYEIIERNNTKVLVIRFGNDTLEFARRIKRNKS